MIKVLKTGTELTVQDLGRNNLRRYGVPQSGAMDTTSAIRANLLVGNRPDAALLECYLSGQHLEALASLRVAVAGAKAMIRLNNHTVNTSGAFEMTRGDVLRIGKLSLGSRIYVAIKGGLAAEKMLGSCSELTGFMTSAIRKGETIKIHNKTNRQGTNSRISSLDLNPKMPVKVYQGPEFHLLGEKRSKTLLSSSFNIDAQSNRMGYRLEARNLRPPKPVHIISSAVMPGTVQWLPDGNLILLMRNCQTVGGYPRILQISELSLNQVAQRRPGQDVAFELIE